MRQTTATPRENHIPQPDRESHITQPATDILQTAAKNHIEQPATGIPQPATEIPQPATGIPQPATGIPQHAAENHIPQPARENQISLLPYRTQEIPVLQGSQSNHIVEEQQQQQLRHQQYRPSQQQPPQPQQQTPQREHILAKYIPKVMNYSLVYVIHARYTTVPFNLCLNKNYVGILKISNCEISKNKLLIYFLLLLR